MDSLCNSKLDMKPALEGVTNRKPKTENRKLLSYGSYKP